MEFGKQVYWLKDVDLTSTGKEEANFLQNKF